MLSENQPLQCQGVLAEGLPGLEASVTIQPGRVGGPAVTCSERTVGLGGEQGQRPQAAGEHTRPSPQLAQGPFPDHGVGREPLRTKLLGEAEAQLCSLLVQVHVHRVTANELQSHLRCPDRHSAGILSVHRALGCPWSPSVWAEKLSEWGMHVGPGMVARGLSSLIRALEDLKGRMVTSTLGGGVWLGPWQGVGVKICSLGDARQEESPGSQGRRLTRLLDVSQPRHCHWLFQAGTMSACVKWHGGWHGDRMGCHSLTLI